MNVLVVEDNFLVADVIRLQLEGAGHSVVGPVARMSEALPLVRSAAIDAAVLDVNLGRDGFVTPLADALEAVGVPFVFLTGYPVFHDPRHPLGRFEGVPVLNKPYKVDQLVELVERMERRDG